MPYDVRICHQTYPFAVRGPAVTVPVVPAGITAISVPDVLGLERRLSRSVTRTVSPMRNLVFVGGGGVVLTPRIALSGTHPPPKAVL